MSEANTNTDAEFPEESTQQQTRASPSDPTDPTGPTNSTDDFEIRKNLYRAALGLFVLLAVVAVVQLYTSVNATIDTFISHEYQPLFRAAFNLVVLLVAGIGISWSVRELSGASDD